MIVDGEGFGLATAVGEVRLAPGDTLDLPVRFAPARTGFVSGVLTVTSDASNTPSLTVTLQAAAVDPPACDDDNQCTVDTFDLELEACLYEPIERDCTDPCLQEATCLNGACVGTARTCPAPVSACKIALCASGVGCVELDDPDACDDGDPCTADSCDEVTGCRHTPLGNGTPCGAIDGCEAAPVCLDGTCTDLPVPDGVPCDDGDLCTTGDVCQAGACVGLGAELGEPAVTDELLLGAVNDWAELPGGLLVGATQNRGALYDLLLFSHAPGDTGLTLVDQLPVSLSGYSAPHLTRADAGHVFSFADRPNGGTGLRITAVSAAGFGASSLVEGTGAIEGALSGTAWAPGATYLCFTQTVGLGAMWRVDLAASPTSAASTDTECQRLIDNGTGQSALVTYGLDLRHVTLAPAPEVLNDLFQPSSMLQTTTLLARGPVVFTPGVFNRVRFVDLTDGSVGYLEGVDGRPRGLDGEQLWVELEGTMQLWDIADVSAPSLLATSPTSPLVDPGGGPVMLGETFAAAGQRVAVRGPDGFSVSLVSHPRLVTPQQIAVEASSLLVYAGRGAAGVSLSADGQLVPTSGGQWPVEASGALVHRGPPGLGPVWLLQGGGGLYEPLQRAVGEVVPQVGAEFLDAAFASGSAVLGDPLGTGGDVALRGDGRYLIGLQTASADLGEVGVALFDALDVNPTAAGAPLIPLATATIPVPPGVVDTHEPGDLLRLHRQSRTFAAAHRIDRLEDPTDLASPEIDAAQIVIGTYGPDGLGLLAQVLVDGDPLMLAVGAGTALVAVEEHVDLGPDSVQLWRVDLIGDSEALVGEVTLEGTLLEDNDATLLLWDGSHLVAQAGGALTWFDVAADGSGTVAGTLPTGSAIDVAVSDQTLLLLQTDRLSAVQPPCPAP